MDSLENEVRAAVDSMEDKIKRISTISQIIESITNSSIETKTPKEFYDAEEYYLSQINKWIISCERKTKELEEQEKLFQHTQAKYLASLRRIKELEDEIQNINEKYLYYKSIQKKMKEEK